jgi:hypothetical protein
VRDRCCVFLSFEKRSRHQHWRETIGLIDAPLPGQLPPSQTKRDYRPARAMPLAPPREIATRFGGGVSGNGAVADGGGAAPPVATAPSGPIVTIIGGANPAVAASAGGGAIRPTGDVALLARSQPIHAAHLIKRPSEFTTAPSEILGPMGASAYATTYPWKVAPKAAVCVQQRAHDASVRGPPWGIISAPTAQHWTTHTRESFAGHEYRFDTGELLRELDASAEPTAPTASGKAPRYLTGPGQRIGHRRYQNYNENFSDRLLVLDRKRRKGEVVAPPAEEVQLAARMRMQPAVQSAFAVAPPHIARHSPA